MGMSKKRCRRKQTINIFNTPPIFSTFSRNIHHTIQFMSGGGVHELHNRKGLQARQPHGRYCKWSIGRSCLKTPPLAGAVGPHDDSTRMLWSTGLHRLYKPGELSWITQHNVQWVDSLALAPTNSMKKELKCRTMTVIAKNPQNLNCQLQLLHFLHKALTRRLVKVTPWNIWSIGAWLPDSPHQYTCSLEQATVAGKSNNNHNDYITSRVHFFVTGLLL